MDLDDKLLHEKIKNAKAEKVSIIILMIFAVVCTLTLAVGFIALAYHFFKWLIQSIF